jgi:hypothetical protein
MSAKKMRTPGDIITHDAELLLLTGTILSLIGVIAFLICIILHILYLDPELKLIDREVLKPIQEAADASDIRFAIESLDAVREWMTLNGFSESFGGLFKHLNGRRDFLAHKTMAQPLYPLKILAVNKSSIESHMNWLLVVRISLHRVRVPGFICLFNLIILGLTTFPGIFFIVEALR